MPDRTKYDGTDDAPPARGDKRLRDAQQENDSEPARVRVSEAEITAAVTAALRSIGIAPRLRIKKMNLAAQYAIDDDSLILAAAVHVDFSLIFPVRESEAV